MLVLALAMTMAATGCKKKPVNTTPLPGQRVGTPGGSGMPITENMRPFTPDDSTIGSKPGEIGTSTAWDPNDPSIVKDESKFAPFTVYFAFDSSAVRSGEHMKIESVAAAMQSDSGLLLLIEGHCDERGTEEYNRSLGEKRALSLREELVKAGINPDRIRTVSFGEDKPAVSGHDESAWSKNRRGVFVACTRRNT